ncbi:MAG: proprotein convertase P-domain-containing protein [Polyangiaceae bacterium]
MTVRKLTLPLALVALAACAAEATPTTDAETANATETILDGSPEGVGVLAFLNDGETSLAVLDDDVPLPSHAAKALVAHRDGPDATFGTGDDDLYDDVYEVLAVKHVGPARLETIAAYAAQQGFVPQGDELLGVYDGVPFTVNEAEATLAFVNAATFAFLDDEVGLDKRAAESIAEATPIETVLELSKLYFVGESALLKLKGWAVSTDLPGEGDDCTADPGCQTGLQCTGIPNDDSPKVGKCVDTGSVPGQGDSCGYYTGECPEGLTCMGITVYSGEGFCRPPWMMDAFESTETVTIPDDDPAGISTDVVVYGLASVPEDVVVTLYIDHPRPQDLHVELISANGSSTVLWNNEQNPDYYTSETWGIERDNYVNGTWTLKVVDSVAGEVGSLEGYKLLISSRWD